MSYDNGQQWGQPEEPPRTRSGQQPGYAPGWQPSTQSHYAPRPPKKSHRGRAIVLGVIAGAAFVAVVASITDSIASPRTPAAATTVTTQQPVGATGAARPAAAAPSRAAGTSDDVAFTCTGSAPDGVDITYGQEGTDDSGSHLPFHATVALDSGAQYYNVTAQLSGSGHVTCTTVVEAGGESVTQTGNASGGYNIASAEVCTDYTGGWVRC